ncbi:MAG: NAD(P)H-dependent oxidoreductase [Nitrolancea sp.]
MTASNPQLEVLIVFYSRFGTVGELAEQIASGAREVDGMSTSFLAVEDQPIGQLRPGENVHDMEMRRAQTIGRFATSDAIVIGSPAYFGSMAAPLKRLFEDCVTAEPASAVDASRPWRHHLFRNKVGAAFTSSATPHGGNEMTLTSILTLMMHMGMLLVTPGQREPLLEHVAAPYGATAVSGAKGDAPPSAEEAEAARELGRRVAEVAQWVVRGRLAWERERAAAERGYVQNAENSRPESHASDPE